MLKTLIRLLAGVVIITRAFAADVIPLTDTSGVSLGSLPYVIKGVERLVPLSMLIRAGEGYSQQSGSDHILAMGSDTATLRAGNSFGRAGTRFIQLRFAPEEWDGSLWVPLSNIRDLFPTGVEIFPDASAIRILKPEHAPVVTSPSTEPKAGGAERWELKTVIVDPGHGGKDSGAKGLYNLIEKDITLDIARRLARKLEDRGITALMTRNSDRFISLQDRTHFANEKRGDLMLSIHCNSSKSPDSKGFEAYFLKPARTERAIETAMRENEVVKLENGDAQYQDLTQDNYILLTMATSQYMRDSESWAATMVRLGSSAVGFDSRGVDQAGFYVLMGASMPAVLVECGFLTNPDDAKVLASERGRQKIADALLESILKLKTNLEGSASR